MKLKSAIESLLLASAKPLTIQKLANLTKVPKEEVKEVVKKLIEEYKQREGGILIMRNGNQIQMTTAPSQAKVIKDFLKDEQTGELTRPSLETLTIIAYRGPITKVELDQIRGVNCALILRNLMIKGLVEAEENKKEMVTYYRITFDFMKYLGISDLKELPDYERLNRDKNLEELLDQVKKSS